MVTDSPHRKCDPLPPSATLESRRLNPTARRQPPGRGAGAAWGRLVVLLVAIAIPSAATAVIDVVGTTRTAFEWSPATGPVDRYSVWVSVNGARQHFFSDVNGARIELDGTEVGAGVGDTLAIAVVARDADGGFGPFSLASEPVRFVDQPDEEPPPNPDPPIEEPPAPVDPPAPDPFPPAALPGRVLDFDGDARSDILMLNEETRELRFLGMKGNRVERQQSFGLFPESLDLLSNGDHDGDGHADIVFWAREVDRIVRVSIYDLAAKSFGLVSAVRAGDEIEHLATADFDGDADADYAVLNRSTGKLEIWESDGPDVLSVRELRGAPALGWDFAGAGDFDADGTADLLWHHPGVQRLDVWYIKPTGVTFGFLPRAYSDRIRVVASADLNGDDRDDIVWLDSLTSQLRLWKVEGLTRDAGWLVPEDLPLPPAEYALRGVGDYDGDGSEELLMQTSLSADDCPQIAIDHSVFSAAGESPRCSQLEIWSVDWSSGTTVTERATIGTLKEEWTPVGLWLRGSQLER